MKWFKKPITTSQSVSNVTTSILYNEETFYNQFTHDLAEAKHEVIIESPFITIPRLKLLKSVFEGLVQKGVNVVIITKPPHELIESMNEQSEAGISYFEVLGAQVLLCEGHHRKLAFIDRKIVWKGSLNILSQTHSREFMEREENTEKAETLFKFLKYDQVDFFKKSI